MSHFYVTAEGSARTSVSRCGTHKSGVSAHPRGWHCGVSVQASVTGTGDEWPTDSFNIAMTGGSAGYARQPLASVIRDEEKGGWIVELIRPDGSTETLTYGPQG